MNHGAFDREKQNNATAHDIEIREAQAAAATRVSVVDHRLDGGAQHRCQCRALANATGFPRYMHTARAAQMTPIKWSYAVCTSRRICLSGKSPRRDWTSIAGLRDRSDYKFPQDFSPVPTR
jgi:hypothetical protein